MIEHVDNEFLLQTDNTTYAFKVQTSGLLEHLYYGDGITLPSSKYLNKYADLRYEEAKNNEKKKSNEELKKESYTGLEIMSEKHEFITGNTNSYDEDNKNISLENLSLEYSGLGKGDIRDPFVELTFKDGSWTTDFRFDSYEISTGKDEMESLPSSYDIGDDSRTVDHLKIILKDRTHDVTMELHYYVFAWCDCIVRRSVIVNNMDEEIIINRLMSSQIDMASSDYMATIFGGAWAREMHMSRVPLRPGKFINSSFTGSSSNRANPFVMIHNDNTTEDMGEVMGINLIYSGNHYECFEINNYGKTRAVWGINPSGFEWTLGSGEKFESPEAVMTYSSKGFNDMSHHMHSFVSEHIARGKWKGKRRPVLLNSWEASYFDITESKLYKLAKVAKEVGVELFVMDDGWFKGRNNDTSSLGDWYPDEKKLPNGIKGICDKVNDLGLDFGIWVEPEMVNVNSDLYKAHPEWVMQIDGAPHSEGRNQRILDLGKKDVQDFIIETMRRILSSANISYVKWDMNRTMTDVYSRGSSADEVGKIFHNYMTGLYRVLKTVKEEFPDVLLEGCAAGGNRFDLGMLCYFDQIWGSDNTDAICRGEIQNGYSYGYPLKLVSAHVSDVPNHQTLRVTPLDTRFAVAAFGSFGYECNLCDLRKEELSEIKAQTELYKKWRDVVTHGRFYRGRNFFNHGSSLSSAPVSGSSDKGNVLEWTYVTNTGDKAMGMVLLNQNIPNMTYEQYKPKGLIKDKVYRFTGRDYKHNIKTFGSLVNNESPVHIKQGSLMQEIASKFIKMDEKGEDYIATGLSLINAGVVINPSFGGLGYNDKVRLSTDYSARLYFMEEMDLQ